MRGLSLSLPVVGLLAAAMTANAQWRPVDDARLENAGQTGEDWPSYGLTPGETRYSPLDQITDG